MNGFGRGRGAGRGMGFGFGRGAGFGRGFGFRGTSPPWPYVGRGRGGLPRCGYFFDSAAYPGPVYGAPTYGPTAPVTSEEEISHLRDQAETIRTDLDAIESRMRDLESN